MFIKSVGDGDLQGVRRALAMDRGLARTKVTDVGTPLFVAAQAGHTAIVRELLQWGADATECVVDCGKEGFTPLLAAAQEGHNEVCSLLLASGSNVEERYPLTKSTALHMAACNGHHETVKTILSHGAAVDSVNHLGQTALYAASQEGHLTCVLSLIQAAASLSMTDGGGRHPIHEASKSNRAAVIRALLDHGCDKELVSVEMSSQPIYYRGPIFVDARA